MIVKYLRHSENAPRDSFGFVFVSFLLSHFRISREKLDEIVDSARKTHLKFSPDLELIRAICGHTTSDVSLQDLASEPIDINSDRLDFGTMRDAIDSIYKNGLNKMSRNYVHFTSSMSNIRTGSEVLIHLDVRKYLRGGNKLYRLSNGVIAAPGNKLGIVRPCYFKDIKSL